MSFYLQKTPSEKEIQKAIDSYGENLFEERPDDKLVSYQLCRLFYLSKFTHKKATILDIGCGNGVFLMHAKKLGFNAFGMDKSKAIVVRLRKKGFTMFDSLQKIPDNAFDVVTLFDVIEHVTNPKQFLQTVKKKLKRGGILVLTTPNAVGITAKIVPSILTKTPTPYSDHPVIFSPKAIELLLEDEKFTILEFKTDILLQWCYVNIGPIGKIVNKIVYLFFLPVLRPLFSRHLGDNMQIIAKK